MPLVYSNFLEIDTDIFNTLVDAKKGGHKLLKHFKILYPEKVPDTPINAIYISRIQTQKKKSQSTFDSDTWTATIEIVITTKDHPKVERRRLLKSAVISIRNIINRSNLPARFEQVYFDYSNRNVIQSCRMIYYCSEYNVSKEETEYLKICKILDDIEIKENIDVK